MNAECYIIWDKIFGTFVPELKSDKPCYGIVKNIGTFNPFKVAFHEWIAMFCGALQSGLTAAQRLRYIVIPPGWRHDGNSGGSNLLKMDYVRRHPAEAGKPGLPGSIPLRLANSQPTFRSGI